MTPSPSGPGHRPCWPGITALVARRHPCSTRAVPGRHRGEPTRAAPTVARPTLAGRVRAQGGRTTGEMHDFVAALDQGTSSTRFMVFDHEGNAVARHQLEHRQILPRPGWVEHDPMRDPRTRRYDDARCPFRSRSWPRRPGRHRANQPAGNDRGVGPAHGAALYERHRLAGHADRPDRGGTGPHGRRTACPPTDGVAAGNLFLGWKDPVGLGELGYGPAGGTGRGRLLRDDRQLASLELHRGRQGGQARHRRDQRQPHDADGPAHAVLGR